MRQVRNITWLWEDDEKHDILILYPVSDEVKPGQHQSLIFPNTCPYICLSCEPWFSNTRFRQRMIILTVNVFSLFS